MPRISVYVGGSRVRNRHTVIYVIKNQLAFIRPNNSCSLFRCTEEEIDKRVQTYRESLLGESAKQARDRHGRVM